MNFLRSCRPEHPGTLTHGGTRGVNVIQQKHSFSGYFRGIQDPVGTQHIGSAPGIIRDPGLTTVMANLSVFEPEPCPVPGPQPGPEVLPDHIPGSISEGD